LAEDLGMNNMEFNFNNGPRKQKLGIKIQDTEEGNAVKIIDVADSSAASKAGLKKDDLITEIEGKKINNTDDAREQLQENKDKNKYNIKAKRNGVEMNFEIKMQKKLKTVDL
jgi:serine protease Do